MVKCGAEKRNIAITMRSGRTIRGWVGKIAEARSHHLERHRPSGFGFAISDRIDLLSAEHWDRLTDSATVFIRRPYLTVLERAGPENVRPRYALIHRNGEPVAAVAMQLV